MHFVFDVSDAYLFPTTISEEVVTKQEFFYKNSYRGRRGSTTYTITTAKREYDVTGSFYHVVNKGDTIYLEHSIALAVQKAYVVKGEHIHTYEIGFLRGRLGYILVPIIILGNILLLLFYHKIERLQGRANTTNAIVFFTALLLLFYLF